jgi:hypothetical protein
MAIILTIARRHSSIYLYYPHTENNTDTRLQGGIQVFTCTIHTPRTTLTLDCKEAFKYSLVLSTHWEQHWHSIARRHSSIHLYYPHTENNTDTRLQGGIQVSTCTIHTPRTALTLDCKEAFKYSLVLSTQWEQHWHSIARRHSSIYLYYPHSENSTDTRLQGGIQVSTCTIHTPRTTLTLDCKEAFKYLLVLSTQWEQHWHSIARRQVYLVHPQYWVYLRLSLVGRAWHSRC